MAGKDDTRGADEEIELKLVFAPGGREALLLDPLLAALVPRPMRLGNRYYDTAERDLERARAALRLRQGEGDAVIQTLKSAGHGEGGLSRRGEWQWRLSEMRLDLDVLEALAGQAPSLAALADRALLERLRPVFITDFERIAFDIEHRGALIELAIDHGTIEVGEQRRSIDELELELKRGTPAALWSLAEQLAERVALRPSNASKASRAAALAHPPSGAGALPDRAPALFEAAIDALDRAADAQAPHDELAFAISALRRLADTAAEHAERANRLAERLQRHGGVLDAAGGRDALALARALAA
ncbi:CYTH domain-containing protein [Halotalea alkalilenta]|uniref:CYTH domain-containing protein n=1 Tax=Halotalea alkalilenta TaxID=376489 RepID=A0A172YDB1_9GAMM|nr:CYTH domain-containing protein [Halotalea alkalilenta]ANF57227.1 hypothetical protein A5892_06910 [Halotalea alkalilenta]